MQNEDLHSRVSKLERHLRNMRMAVIIVVAFFVYEALMPPELRPGNREKIHQTLKTEELVLTNRSGEVFARLVVNEDNGYFILRGVGGEQIELSPASASLLSAHSGGAMERLRITQQGVAIYDRDGNLLQSIPKELRDTR